MLTLFEGVVLLNMSVYFSGPYIVYMLRDIDILEDWTAIKKVFVMSDQTFNHGERV